MRLLPLLLLPACRQEGITVYDTAKGLRESDTANTFLETGESGTACSEELCDGLDNDCDGVIDEDDAADAPAWYGDADGDGHGAGLAVTSCAQPAGTAATGDDCDDTDPAAYPGAAVACTDADANCDGLPDGEDADGDHFLGCEECDDTDATAYPGAIEVCDGADDDCDGAIDEEGADAATWYEDADGDGYGGATSTTSCDQPAGYVADDEDCDDTSPSIHPGAEETCNELDDDCDGDVDQGATDISQWYIDYDGDGYGDDAYTAWSCSQPSGYTATNDDCDDTDPAVSPAGTELCNGVDDDCDGTVDEDDAADAGTWYEDADGDGFGNSTIYNVSCDAPSGYVAVDGDCDDADATAWPGAPERYDGVDDDCDGTVDDFTWVGTGADGSLSVTATTTIGEAWAVSAISGATLTVAGSPGLTAGDEVLLISMHGSDGAHTAVGTYEFAWVSSVSGADVTLEDAVAGTYGEIDNSDLTDQAVQLVRVGQYTDVSVAVGAVLTTSAWDGEVGGVLAFRATGTVTVADGGAISVDGLGYVGGETGTCYNCDAFQGESYAGEGDGDLDSSTGYYGNWAAGYYLANHGGGGAMITGGGGEYGGGATSGASWDGGGYPEAEAGETYGQADLSVLFPGSGGAGVWHGSTPSGSGGNGAGILYLGASAVDLQGAAAVSAAGDDTAEWSTGTWTYGAGGGSGGSVWIVADTLTAVAGAVTAAGGAGESSHIRGGGNGGDGRVRVDYNAVNGQGYGGGADGAEVAAACEPDAGWSEPPG